MTAFTISNDDDAIRFINDAIAGKLKNNFEITAEEWPLFSVRYKGEDFDGSVTAEIANAIIAIQGAVNRLYCLCKYKDLSLRRLKDYERKELQIRVHVSKGSTNIKLDLSLLSEALLISLADKMDSTQLTTVAVFGLFALFGAHAWDSFLSNRTERHKTDIELDKEIERTKQIENITAFAGNAVNSVIKIADEMKESIIRSAVNADEVEIAGHVVTQEQVKNILSRKPSRSVAVRLDGYFTILSVSKEDDENFKIGMRNDDGTEFSATVNISAGKDLLRKLADATVTEDLIELHINAKRVNGTITDAEICLDGDLM